MDQKGEKILPHMIKSYKTNEKLYDFIYNIVSLNNEVDVDFFARITNSKNNNFLNKKFRIFIDKFLKMTLLKKMDHIMSYSLKTKKSHKIEIKNLLRERCLIKVEEDDDEDFNEKLNYLNKNLYIKDETSYEKKKNEQSKF